MFDNFSVRNKLIFMMLIVGCTVALTILIGVLITETISQKRLVREQLAMTADLLAANSAAALAFNDAEAANALLQSLKTTPHIVDAELHYLDGITLAHYQKPISNSSSRLLRKLLPASITTTSDVVLDDQKLGYLRLISNIEPLYQNLNQYSVIILLILCFAITQAFWISRWLQKFISLPIVNLRSAMEEVSRTNDYTRRVNSSSEDEMGDLYRGFNRMLEQISARDTQLERYTELLGDEVNIKNAQLSLEQEKRILWLENLARFLRHELKNTMIGFRSSVDLIERKTPDAPIEKYLARARNSLTYMAKILDQVGEASSLEASLYGEEYERLELSSTVCQWLEDYPFTNQKQAFTTSFVQPADIYGNPMRLRQLLEKLINNAADHCTPGTAIEIKVQREDDEIVLTVSNQGAPLPQDCSDLFNLFVSHRSADKQNQENVGIGLYVVRLIAEAHKAKAAVSPLTSGIGAAFTIRFPAAEKYSLESNPHSQNTLSLNR